MKETEEEEKNNQAMNWLEWMNEVMRLNGKCVIKKKKKLNFSCFAVLNS